MDAAIRQGLERAGAIICCDGLGPMQDDITREVVASIMGVELQRDDMIADRIRHMFESRGRVMTANNLHKAEIPRFARARSAPGADWVNGLLERRPPRLVTLAMASKTARIAWALLARQETYRPPAVAAI